MLFNRYRLLTQNEYANHFVTAAPARFTYYLLEVDSTFVEFISSNTMRIQSNHVIGFLIFLVATTNMSCLVLRLRFGKSEKERFIVGVESLVFLKHYTNRDVMDHLCDSSCNSASQKEKNNG